MVFKKILASIYKYFGLILGIGLLSYLFTVVDLKEVFESFKTLNYIYLIPYLVISIAITAGLVFRWFVILKSYNIDVNFLKLALYRLSGQFVSYITPSAKVGGEGVRVYFLMKDYKVNLEKALSCVLTDKMIELSTNGTFTALAMIFFIFRFSIPQDLRFMLIIITVIVLGLVILYYYRLFNNKLVLYPVVQFLRLNKIKTIKRYEPSIIEAERKLISFHKHHKIEFRFSVILSFFLLVFSIYEFKILTLMFNYNISIINVFLILTVVALTTIIPIPAALGVLEGGQITLFKIIKLSKTVGFSIAFLTRIRDIIWSTVGFVYITLRQLKVSGLIKSEDAMLNSDGRADYFRKWKVK